MSTENSLPKTTRISRQKVLAEVKQIVSDELGVALETIREDHRLEEDLGCDSLGRVEIMMEVEEHFDINVSDEVSEDIVTVGQMVDGVMSIIGG